MPLQFEYLGEKKHREGQREKDTASVRLRMSEQIKVINMKCSCATDNLHCKSLCVTCGGILMLRPALGSKVKRRGASVQRNKDSFKLGSALNMKISV